MFQKIKTKIKKAINKLKKKIYATQKNCQQEKKC